MPDKQQQAEFDERQERRASKEKSIVDSRWFRWVRRGFCPRVEEFRGKPITYVEIGCWEGASAKWVADQVLTHPHSRGFGIDPYEPQSPRHRRHRLKYKHTSQAMNDRELRAKTHLQDNTNWTWIRKRSQDALREWPYGSIDLLYIDGAHDAVSVLTDFVLAWRYLSVGAGIIFDDVQIGRRHELRTRRPHVPTAVKAIVACFGNLLKPWKLRRRPGHIGRQAYFKVMRKEIDEQWSKTGA